ncbi:MAG: radical SAM protein [Bacillota bacterium]
MIDLARVAWLHQTEHVKPGLSALVLKLTKACNLRCRYCYVSAVKDTAQMPLELAIRAIDEMAAINPLGLTVYLHGGEPLLAGDTLSKLVSRVSGKDYFLRLSLNLQTNGTMITPQWADFFAKWGIHVGISLVGVDDINDSLRTGKHRAGTFDAVAAGMDALDAHGITYGLVSVVTTVNIDHLVELLEFASSRNVTNVVLNVFVPQGYGKGVDRLAPDNEAVYNGMKDVLWWLVEYNRRHPGRHIVERNLKYMVMNIIKPGNHEYMCMSSPCGAGKRHLAMDVDGTLYACDLFINDRRFSIGNIKDGPLDTLLLGSRAVGELAQRSIATIDNCKACSQRPYCFGGCSAFALYGHGSLNREAPSCGYYKLMIPYLREAIDFGKLDTALVGAVARK